MLRDRTTRYLESAIALARETKQSLDLVSIDIGELVAKRNTIGLVRFSFLSGRK